MASWDAATPAGLVAILDNPKWPVSKACQAVEDCILANRCALHARALVDTITLSFLGALKLEGGS